VLDLRLAETSERLISIYTVITQAFKYRKYNFYQSRDNPSSASAERSARLAIRQGRIYGGFAAVWRASPAAKRACHTGIVKNQQRSAAEPWKISRSEKFALLNFPPSRDSPSGENFSRSARLAIRQGRIYGGFAAVWRASPAAKRACHTGIVKNQQRSAPEA
jgi:alkylhydroperoxidase/carboxymuconolactone decarboxylase family protein YurZ